MAKRNLDDNIIIKSLNLGLEVTISLRNSISDRWFLHYNFIFFYYLWFFKRKIAEASYNISFWFWNWFALQYVSLFYLQFSTQQLSNSQESLRSQRSQFLSSYFSSELWHLTQLNSATTCSAARSSQMIWRDILGSQIFLKLFWTLLRYKKF